MSKANLNRGDIRRIAECLGVCHETIRSIQIGRRGKRGTRLQDAIRQAVALRARQNDELTQYCKLLKVEKVTPR